MFKEQFQLDHHGFPSFDLLATLCELKQIPSFLLKIRRK